MDDARPLTVASLKRYCGALPDAIATEHGAPDNWLVYAVRDRKFAYFNGYLPQQAIDLYVTDGTTIDFGYGELGVASYVFELGTEFFQSCGFFESNVLPGNLPALRYAAKVARTPYQTPAGPEALAAVADPPVVAPGDPVDVGATFDDTIVCWGFNNLGQGTPPR